MFAASSKIFSNFSMCKCKHHVVAVVIVCISWICKPVLGRSNVVQVSACRAIVNGLPINLEPLSSEGKPRFQVSTDVWQWSYNPCSSYNLPQDPHIGKGDKCFSVMVCQWIAEKEDHHYFTAGIDTTAVFTTRRFPQIGTTSFHTRRLLAAQDESNEEASEEVGHPKEGDENVTISDIQNGRNKGYKEEKEVEKDEKEEIDLDEEDQEGEDEHEEMDEDEEEEEEDDDDDEDTSANIEASGKTDSSSSEDSDEDSDEKGGNDKYEDNLDMPVIIFRGLKKNRRQKVFIYLSCNRRKVASEDATFTHIPAVSATNYYFKLSHICCCPGGCPNGIPNIPGNYNDKSNETLLSGDLVIIKEVQSNDYTGPRLMWLVLVVNIGILACAVMIGGMCCRKGNGSGPYYNMLPAIHSSRMTLNSMESYPSQIMKSPELLEYTTSVHRKQLLPVSESGIIDHRDLEMGQRLGGGIFGDTYIAEWKERRVAAKRITVGVHRGQLNDSDCEWLIKEIFYLSKQRHKTLASVLGICMETKQPYVINEFIDGDSLRDIARKDDESYPITRKIKLCMQVADGIAFLHSCKHPILHRDLRCSNVIIDNKDKVKIVDYGLTRLLQRLRQACTGRKDCFCQKEQSAYPATIRWTAPEILVNPTTDEYHGGGLICSSCDVYSYGMMLWEVISGTDPYEEIQDETEVIELVLQEVRPNLENLQVIPQLKEIIRACWQQDPDDRPSVKQAAVHLKTVVQIYHKLGGKRNPRKRNDSSTVSYLKSALNMYTS